MTTQECPKYWMGLDTAELMAGYYEVQAKGLGGFMPEFLEDAHNELSRRLSGIDGLHLVGMEPGTGGLLAHCQWRGCGRRTEVDLEWSDGAHKSACWHHAKNVGRSRDS